VAEIPLWPWNRHVHRCLDCGFLSKHWTDENAPLVINGRSTTTADVLPRCFRAAYDLSGETEAIVVYPLRPEGEREHWPEDVASDWEAACREAERGATQEVIARSRRCSSFTAYQPGLSFEAHRELQLRRADRQWTLASALVGALTGCGLTLAAVVAVLLAS
jgi:hypothetical protein